MNSAPYRDSSVEQPVALHERAAENLSYIRDAMTRATAFTALSGVGTVGMGVVAVAGAAVASFRFTNHWWLGTWCVVACIAFGVGFAGLAWKARRTATPLLSGPGRRMATSFAPPVVAGAVLTAVFSHLGIEEWLPGTWLLLYGAGVVTGGAFSVRIVPLMGLCFMAAGVTTFAGMMLWGLVPVGDMGMAVGFGAINIAFGLVIARRYGG